MAGDRWALFRRLCRYYRDCLRLDDHAGLRVRADHAGDSWATLADDDALTLGDGTAVALPLPTDQALSGLLATIRRREDWSTWLGHPLLSTSRGGHAWRVPVLVRPIRLRCTADAVRIEPDGPILPNRAALDLIFDDTRARQVCLERIGLVPAELGDAAVDADLPLRTLIAALRREGVIADDVGGALVAATRRGQYHRRLAEELHLLAEAVPEEELEASALRYVFAGDRPEPASGDDACGLRPLATAHPLDPDQRRAVQAALRDPVTVVTVPPGTGKSTMVRHLLVNTSLRGGTALLASRNHRALDAVEPALNALAPGEPLIVRTSHHGQQRSWQHGLLDLLDRDDADLCDPAIAAARWRETCDQAALLARDLGDRCALDDAYGAACQQWRAALDRVPAGLRAAVAGGAWTGPDDEAITAARRELAALARGGWRDLVPPGAARRVTSLTARIGAWARAAGVPEPSADDLAACGACLDALAAAAAAQAAWDRCRDAAARRDQLGIDRDRCLAALGAAERHMWQTGVAWLVERAAAGPDDPHARDELANLRAGIASFGLARWAASYRDRFPLLLAARPLWACSNLSAPATLPRRGGLFDLLVLDEASQCDIPGIIPLLFRCRRVLAVGDPQQLGHITGLAPVHDERLLAAHGLTGLATQRFGYRATSAWRLLRETPGVAAPILLADHYRSHPHIAALFNRAFYRKRLQVCTREERLRAPARCGAGVHWHDVSRPLLPAPHGACAPDEADRIAALIAELEADGYRGTIGVATPFRQQVALLRGRIDAATSAGFRTATRLLVATAHGFQGDERDCLFFSLCGGDDLRPGAARFLAATPHLFNVAVSRARAALHLVGNRTWAAHSGLDFIRHLATGADEQDPEAAAVSESPPERELREALAAAGIDTVPQYAAAGRRIDLAVIDGRRRLAIEIDGAAHHATATGARADDDCWRDLLLTEAGWRVLRFWAEDVRQRGGACVAAVLAALEGG